MEDILTGAVDSVPGIVVTTIFALVYTRMFIEYLKKRDAADKEKDLQFTETLNKYADEILGGIKKIDDKISDRRRSI